MRCTLILEEILEKANEVKNEFNCEYLCASHVAVAIADYCKTMYTGFAVSDKNYPSCKFEEERLRYAFSKEVKLSSFFRMCLSKNVKNGVYEEKFDISDCERILSALNTDLLSADIAFLWVLKELPKPYSAAVRSVVSDDAIFAALQDIDVNIFDYVIDKIEDICKTLKEKSDNAASIRDWKPALKFAEPEKLEAIFFERIEKSVCRNVITLKFPKFFGAANLKVSIHKVGEIYYVQDNGCAIKHLLKQVEDVDKCERILKRVCNKCWIVNKRITGSFIDSFGFLYYLQKLVFVAHADLYYTKAEKQLYLKEKGYVYYGAEKAEPIDEVVLIEQLKKGISFNYDENYGLYYVLNTRYSLCENRVRVLMECFENSDIRVSDLRKGKYEGEIFESFYWDNNDLSQYSKFIMKIAARFGADFDGRNICITNKNKNFVEAIFKFFNLAILLSEVGHDIELPKIRGKV